MTWLKTTWGTVSAFFLFALALFAAASAARQKAVADQWKDKAVDIELGNVVKGVDTAKAASAQAKLHEAKAKEKKAIAEARISKIAENRDEVADILDRWRKP